MRSVLRHRMCRGMGRGLAWALAWTLSAAAVAHERGARSPDRAPQSAAHAHGVAHLDVVLEGDVLTIELEAPLDSMVGFEHRPRTDAQRRRADEAWSALRAHRWGLAEAAGCAPQTPQIDAPWHAPGEPAGRGATPSAPEHADVRVLWRHRCARPDRLRGLDAGGWFQRFPRVERLEVQVAGPEGQRRRVLDRNRPLLDWGR